MDLEEKVEELARKVEKLETEKKELEEEVRQLKKEDKDNHVSNKISRRGFLKKLGAGAAGIGAMGLASASGLKLTNNGISNDSGLDFLDSGTDYFKINKGGPVEIKNTDLRLDTGQAIENGSGDDVYSLDGNGRPVMHTSTGLNDGDLGWYVYDDAGSYSAFRYYVGSSAPGTLEFTNTYIDMSNEPITSVRRIQGNHIYDGGYDAGSGQWKIQGHDGQISGFADGDVSISSAQEGSGGAKTATLFDYSGGSVSSERFKKNIRELNAKPYGILDVKAVTYETRDDNENTAHGFIAEHLYNWSEHAVHMKPLSEKWAHEEYVNKYGYDVGDMVPNQPKKWPVIAAHHEILRDLVARIEKLEEKVE